MGRDRRESPEAADRLAPDDDRSILGKGSHLGVEKHQLEGVEVSITSRAKTVADCFKYRNKIGLDVALDALRDYLRKRGRSMDGLLRRRGLPGAPSHDAVR